MKVFTLNQVLILMTGTDINYKISIISSLTQQIQNCSVYVQVASWEKWSYFLSTVVLGNGVKEKSLLACHQLCLLVFFWKGINTLLAELFPCNHNQLVRKKLQAVCCCRQPPIQPAKRKDDETADSRMQNHNKNIYSTQTQRPLNTGLTGAG